MGKGAATCPTVTDFRNGEQARREGSESIIRVMNTFRAKIGRAWIMLGLMDQTKP